MNKSDLHQNLSVPSCFDQTEKNPTMKRIYVSILCIWLAVGILFTTYFALNPIQYDKSDDTGLFLRRVEYTGHDRMRGDYTGSKKIGNHDLISLAITISGALIIAAIGIRNKPNINTDF